MIKYNKNNNPSELGPWVHGLSFKEPDQLEEDKNNENANNTNNTNQHQRTSLKLPNITKKHRNSLSTKKSKHLLKVSLQSLDLQRSALKQTNSKSRYGALNGSLFHSFKGKGMGQQCKISRSPLGNSETIDYNTLDRKVSMVQLGDPSIHHRVSRGRKRILMNEQCAKKRSLMHIIREVTVNKQLMDYYLLNKRQKVFKFSDI